ncbi:MAG: hypothetical protein ACQESG_06875 [Nanobdellota archaeon]
MNPLLHFFINYLVIDALFGTAADHAFVIFIASTIIDLDHIPYLYRKRQVFGKLGAECRTRFHELWGVTLVGFAGAVASLFLPMMLVQMVVVCLLLHLAVDFVVGQTRPLYPYSTDTVFLHILSPRYRPAFEMTLTVAGVLVWLS